MERYIPQMVNKSNRIKHMTNTFSAVLSYVSTEGTAAITVTNNNNTMPVATPYVWNFIMDNLQNLTITLPKVNDSESFVKHSDDQEFYFDVVNGPEVDNQRWGSAIPALLSGPEADNMVQQNANKAQLQQYGLDPAIKPLNIKLLYIDSFIDILKIRC